MCPLHLPSSSRWPSGNPARRPEECTDKLSSGGYIPLNPLTASPIFVTAIVALRAHERTAAGRLFFFRDYNEDSPWGWDHWLKKKDMPVLATGRECWSLQKYGLDSLAQRVSSNSEHLRQSVFALSYFSKGESVFLFDFYFSWKHQTLLDLYFWGLCPKYFGW